MFEKFFEQYESEEHEVIVIIGNSILGPTKNADTNIYDISIQTMAMLFCDSGELVTKKMWLDMPVAEEDCNNDALIERFEPEKLFRLKVRKMKKECQDLSSTPEWCISQVINEHEECPVLSNLLEEYHKDVVIHDDMLGDLELDKQSEEFTSELIWCDETVSFALLVNALGQLLHPKMT